MVFSDTQKYIQNCQAIRAEVDRMLATSDALEQELFMQFGCSRKTLEKEAIKRFGSPSARELFNANQHLKTKQQPAVSGVSQSRRPFVVSNRI